MSRSNEAPPLILITNDDGIESPGLRATAQAALPLGDVLVVAPSRQWSGAGRSLPHDLRGTIARRRFPVDGRQLPAYQVDGSPAAAVLHGLFELSPRRPALLISGINFGENVGADVTISGTVGAAIEAAANGLPALAVSLQTPKETHSQPSDGIDFTAAIHFTRLFAHRLLQVALPFDVDVLKVDVPSTATHETPWRLTRVSRHTYFTAVPPERGSLGDAVRIDYEPLPHPERTEPDSDIYALAVDRVVSVAPLSHDLTSRVDRGMLEELFLGPKGR
ncbi:MAG: 5'/3'-nucleotidase SurE [Chloroflexota bacterium]|nr:5'/3'-nucleotidase SurE [Chloroflexota bacterium]